MAIGEEYVADLSEVELRQLLHPTITNGGVVWVANSGDGGGRQQEGESVR